MTNRQQHSIQKVILQLDIQGQQESVFPLQNELKALVVDQAEGEWNDLFDQVVSPAQTLRIPKLEIDLGKVSKRDFKKILLKKLETRIQQITAEAKIFKTTNNHFFSTEQSDSTGFNLINHSQKDSDLFLYFLEKGTFPWWARKVEWASWQKALIQQLSSVNTSFPLDKTRELLAQNQECCDRLYWQFSKAFLTKLLPILEETLSETAKKVLLTTYKKSKLTIETVNTQKRLEKFLSALRSKKTTLVVVENEISDLGQNNLTIPKVQQQFGSLGNSVIKPALVSENHTSPSVEDYYYIDNAGLVIILPFAAHIFEEMGYLKSDKQFKTSKKQIKAIHLLQYMAYGANDYQEHELLFNKLICGWELDQPIPKKSNITKKEKQQADDFLKEIIEQWGAMKNMSPAGLRSNFLARKGKLSFMNNHWLLQIESMAFDPFLLNKLPWTISIIKNKWMTKRIHVEWNN